jgi:hypothetical protein
MEKALFSLSTGMSVARCITEDEGVTYDFYMSFQAFRGLTAPPDDIPDLQAWRKDASHAYLNILRKSNAKGLFYGI